MTERNYKKEYKDYHSKPENMADRVKRNLWNRRLKDKVPAGKEIDHKNALASGGSNDKSNIRYRSISENRADKSMLKSAFLFGVGGEGVGAYAKNNIPHAMGNSLSDRIANKVLGRQVYVNGVNVELQNKKKNIAQQKTAAYGATLGALGADEGVENKVKGAVAGTAAGWVATPPALMLAAKMLKNSDGKINGKIIKDMTTKEFAKNLIKFPKQAINAIGKKRFLLATVGTPYALGGISSFTAGKYYGRNNSHTNKGENDMQKIAVGGMIGGLIGADEGVENKLKGAAAGTLSAWPAKPLILGSHFHVLRNTPSTELFDVAQKGGGVASKTIKQMTNKELLKTLFSKDSHKAISAIGMKRYLAGAAVGTGVETAAGYAAGKYFGRDKIPTPDIIKRNATKENIPTMFHGLAGLKKYQEKKASIEYRGEHFDGYNKPKQAPAGDDHKMVVLAKKGDDVKLIRFGKRGYEHNYSKDAKQNYLTRSAGIRDKSGNLTKDDKLSANYWARKTLWPKNQKADGTSTVSKDRDMGKNAHYEFSYTDRQAVHRYRGMSKLAMGSINRKSWEHLLEQAQEGDIFSHNTDLAHYAKEEGAKKGVSGLAISGGIKKLTGSPEHHTAMVGIDPKTGKKAIYHLHETAGKGLSMVDPEKYINDFGKHTDLTLIRPNMSDAEKKKAMDFVQKRLGDDYAYHDIPAHAAKQVANKVGLGGVVDKAHSVIMGGVKKCDDATGVCSTLPAKAYSKVDPNFVEKHLGMKSGDSRLIAPKDYAEAVKKGLMTQVGKYEFSDRDLSPTKAVVGAVTKDAKDAIKGVGSRVFKVVSKLRK